MMAPGGNPDFDGLARDYDTALMRGVSVSGESREFFARGRLLWLKRCLDQLRFSPRCVMDYGCGTAASTPFVFEILRPASLVGVDVSIQSLAVAREAFGTTGAEFRAVRDYPPGASLDLVFCNGVFHHIPPAERPGCVDYIRRCLRPGGLFALWENNPWNPGTQIVMARIPFDRDAVKVPPPVARRLLTTGGFEVISITYQFLFPAMLACLRRLETPLSRFPLGAQYQVLARRGNDP